ncbi:hypothetical protein Tco_1017665 [Tanacetum coccineum]|uniref:Uncharacterized protein n=1 Tax=Tanacetum coccineum TaxID=301880 RepID=A0ABQ5FS62_9ASTR
MEYAPTTYQQQQPEFSQPDSSLVVPVFQKGDDPIDAINHMMSFLTAVFSKTRFPYYQQSARTSQTLSTSYIYDGTVTCATSKIALMAQTLKEWLRCTTQENCPESNSSAQQDVPDIDLLD